MSRAVSPQGAPNYAVNFAKSKEREFYKYLPPYHLKAHALQHFGPTTPSTEYAPHTSADPVLTAFAQLGALRLNAQRALISLFGPNEQHVLTEATRTLSLQDDTDHDARDELWVGSCTLSYERSLCRMVMRLTPDTTNPSDRVCVVPDLTLNDALKDHPDVTTFPNIRFVASSPIISPNGVVIGAYTILDDKPHAPLDAGILKFLSDISITVMNYLATNRSKEEHLRSERMLVGLGSFLEGEGSLRNSWLSENDSLDNPFATDDHIEGRVNLDQQQIQVTHNAPRPVPPSLPSSHLPFRPYNLYIPREKASQACSDQDDVPDSAHIDRKTSAARPKLKRALHPTRASSDDQLRQQSSKDDYLTKVKETFSRASNLIRESIEVEAVVFFDADVGFGGALVDDTNSDPETSSSVETCSSSEDDIRSRGSQGSQHGHSLDPRLAARSGKATLNPCEILGFATSNVSSINNQATDNSGIALSESFLGALLRRYPRGKIFNFGADGTVFSDETSEGPLKGFFRAGGKRYKKTQKTIVRQDAQTLLQLAPESRSIVFTPLWDSHKGRWYAGSLTWTRATHRVFTSNDELAFLLTFGNSVMAEVHRLGAHFAERAKSDLLAGLSHELRSPLHGIFGTAELLGDTLLDTLQRGFLHTVSSCAFTLLGSINQLLEYSSINDVQPSSVMKPRIGGMITTDRSRSAVRRFSHPSKVDIDTYVELDGAVEDAIETVVAGYSFLGNPSSLLRGVTEHSTPGGKLFHPKGDVKVILDIDVSESWKFSTRVGAWHVIITNLFGNAMKFTQQGHIYVSMRATPTGFGVAGQVVSSEVTLTIKDTGCGIDSAYLENGLYTAFSQENSITIGNGLGLNITRRMLKSLGGNIQVYSQKNVGTEVVATVNLDHSFEGAAPSPTSGQFSINDMRELTRNKSIGVLGFETSQLDIALRTSLQRVCRDWLAMDVRFIVPSQAPFVYCDFYISLHEHFDIGDSEIQPITPGPNGQLSSPLILICSSPKVAHSMFFAAQRRKDADVFEFISQPCGPRKLAKTLETCIKRQQQRVDSVSATGETPDRSFSPSGYFGRHQPEEDYLTAPAYRESRGQSTIDAIDQNARSGSRSRDSDDLMYPPDSPPEAAESREVLSEDDTAITPSQPVASQSNPTSDAALNQSIVVLLVDDNEINLKLLIAFMERLNCDYAIARNGEEALEAFKSNFSNIHMILMDISMPIMDGLESTRRIREFENTLATKPRVTIAALTGLAQADVQRDAIGSGMDLFLTKPVRLDNLVPIIQAALPKSYAICRRQS